MNGIAKGSKMEITSSGMFALQTQILLAGITRYSAKAPVAVYPHPFGIPCTGGAVRPGNYGNAANQMSLSADQIPFLKVMHMLPKSCTTLHIHVRSPSGF